MAAKSTKRKSETQKRKRVQLDKETGRRYYISQKTGKRVYVSDSYLAPSLKKKVNALKKNVGKARGAPTRGWIGRKPYTLAEKREVQNKCGSKCFLNPKKLGYPVCAKCENGTCPCQFDRQGVQSAFNRANQYHKAKFAQKAKKILAKMSKQ